MLTLFIKYYFRNGLWVSFYPVVFILLELVLPLDLTVLPFFFILQTLMRRNYFTPLNEGLIHATNFRYLKAVVVNNLISLITGVFFFSLFGLALSTCKRIFMHVTDHRGLYQFLPILIWAISLGNMYVYLQYRWPSTMIWFSTLYKGLALLLIFCVSLMAQSDALLSAKVLVLGVVTMLPGYYLIHRTI